MKLARCVDRLDIPAGCDETAALVKLAKTNGKWVLIAAIPVALSLQFSHAIIAVAIFFPP